MGVLVKLARLFLVVAFLGICATAARADDVDPKVVLQGCGGNSGTACDAVTITGQSISFSETFSCSTTCTAEEGIINGTGQNITQFSAALDTGINDTLVYSLGQGGLTGDCSLSGNILTCLGLTIVSQPTIEPEVYTTDSVVPCATAVPACIHYTGVNIVLNAGTNEGITNGETLSNNTFAVTPEPSSVLLLFSGIMVGLVGLKFRNSATS